MKKFNLSRLMDGCCVDIDKDYYEELFDFLIDSDIDLNELNIDDLVSNGIQYFYNDENFNRDDYYILSENENGFYAIL